MEKDFKHLGLFAIPLFCVIIFCLVLILTGTATPFITCFGVDGNDLLYVGVQDEIRVYEDGIFVRTINPQTSKSYVFAIEGNQIRLSTASKEYRMDLYGNILYEQADLGANTYNQIQYKKRRFVTDTGEEYKMVSQLGWSRIVKNRNEIVKLINELNKKMYTIIVVTHDKEFVDCLSCNVYTMK